MFSLPSPQTWFREYSHAPQSQGTAWRAHPLQQHQRACLCGSVHPLQQHQRACLCGRRNAGRRMQTGIVNRAVVAAAIRHSAARVVHPLHHRTFPYSKRPPTASATHGLSRQNNHLASINHGKCLPARSHSPPANPAPPLQLVSGGISSGMALLRVLKEMKSVRSELMSILLQ